MKIEIENNFIINFEYAPFGEAMSFINYILANIKLGTLFDSETLKNISENGLNVIAKKVEDNGGISNIINNITELVGNSEFNRRFFKISEKCTFNNERIIPELFDNNIEYRKYFMQIVKNITWENIKVFLPPHLFNTENLKK